MSGGITVPGDWNDWRWSGRGRSTGPTPPSFLEFAGSGIFCWQFTNAKELHLSDLQLPHDYKEGTDLVPHIHWAPTTTGTYTGTWTLNLIGWLTIDTGEPVTAVQTVTAAFSGSLTAFEMQSQNFSDVIPGAGRKISSIIHARLALSLTAGASCALCGLDAHYQVDRLGSRQVTAK